MFFYLKLKLEKNFYSAISLIYLLSFCYCASAQTPLPILKNPINGDYTLDETPQFSALLNGFDLNTKFNVAISESPRATSNNQYTLFWSKYDVYGYQLLDSSGNLLTWDNSWIKKTRNGNPSAPAETISNNSPSTLITGKKYYWHIVTSDGLYKSAESSFIAGPRPPIFFCNSFNLPSGMVVTSVDYESWNCGSTISPPKKDTGYYAEAPRDGLVMCLTNITYSYDLKKEFNYGAPPAGFVFTQHHPSSTFNYCTNFYDAYKKPHGPGMTISTPYDGQSICSYESPPKAPSGYYISTSYSESGRCGDTNPVYVIRKL